MFSIGYLNPVHKLPILKLVGEFILIGSMVLAFGVGYINFLSCVLLLEPVDSAGSFSL